jgi:hypothetical protein
MKSEQSDEAIKVAEEFIDAIKNGTLSKHILPNNYEDYTLESENVDLQKYKMYLKTKSYFDYLESRGVAYNGQL